MRNTKKTDKRKHEVKVKWLNSSKRTTVRKFHTLEAAHGFIEGIKLCFQELGDGDYEIKYKELI